MDTRRATAAATFVVTAIAGVSFATAAGAAVPKGTSTSWTPSAYASRLAVLVNDARTQHGLPKLTVTAGTSTVALGWTEHIAGAGALSHNPDVCSQVAEHGSPDWTVVEENVGEGSASDPDGLFAAYMDSPEHRSNILDTEIRYVGNGVVFTDGRAWNTMDFVDQYGTVSTSSTTTATRTTAHHRHHHATAPAPAPAPAAAPARRLARHATPEPRRPAAPPVAVAAPRRHPVAARPVHRAPFARALLVDAGRLDIRPTLASGTADRAGAPIGHVAVVGIAVALLLAYAQLSFTVRSRRTARPV